jgi:hypothetical protein
MPQVRWLFNGKKKDAETRLYEQGFQFYWIFFSYLGGTFSVRYFSMQLLYRL